MNGDAYRDLLASYIATNYRPHGLVVYTEVSLGKTIIGKNRRIDLFLLREEDQRALAIECKYQSVSGTTDEKIPYALQDLESMWLPGCLAYAGKGWSPGVLHTLEGSRLAVFCDPKASLERSSRTRELDHVIGAVFGLWGEVLPADRLFQPPSQLALPGLKKVHPRRRPRRKKAATDDES